MAAVVHFYRGKRKEAVRLKSQNRQVGEEEEKRVKESTDTWRATDTAGVEQRGTQNEQMNRQDVKSEGF